MRLSELKNAGRSPALPLSLSSADAAGQADLQLLSLLRVLPGQRYVGAGVWRLSAGRCWQNRWWAARLRGIST